MAGSLILVSIYFVVRSCFWCFSSSKKIGPRRARKILHTSLFWKASPTKILKKLNVRFFFFFKMIFLSRELRQTHTRGYKSQVGYDQTLSYKHKLNVYMIMNYTKQYIFTSQQTVLILVIVKSAVNLGDSNPQHCNCKSCSPTAGPQ